MLKIKNLKKTYADFSLNCSLTVQPGRITGLIGENGAGKSTIFKAVLRLIEADSGTIELFGDDIKNFTEKEKIGVVLSDSGFSGYLTGSQIYSLLKTMYPHFEQEKFLKYCTRFGLPMNKQIRHFSTGMKAKLKTCIAITHQAKFLILDEATAGLDVLARDEILQMLREYMEEDESRAILMSSHISSDLESICDDVYMISKGTILLHEDTDVLLSDYGILKVNEEQFSKLDKTYLWKITKEVYGYRCLTKERQFYQENYPGIVIEKSGVDELIYMMLRGE